MIRLRRAAFACARPAIATPALGAAADGGLPRPRLRRSGAAIRLRSGEVIRRGLRFGAVIPRGRRSGEVIRRGLRSGAAIRRRGRRSGAPIRGDASPRLQRATGSVILTTAASEHPEAAAFGEAPPCGRSAPMKIILAAAPWGGPFYRPPRSAQISLSLSQISLSLLGKALACFASPSPRSV